MTLDLSDTDRRHAADQLGVPPDADPADARAAFLRRLPATGFCPPPPLCAAAASLAGQQVPGAVGVIADDETDDALVADVAAFAKAFWSLRPDSRRERWQRLLDRAASDPRLTARVRRLEAGVDLRDATGVPGPQRQRDVVGMIQALFVLGPIDRAARRRELLDGLPPPAAGWEQAARNLERDLPAHAALEPALVERLATWTRRVMTPAAAAVGRPAPTWGFQTQGGLHGSLAGPMIRRPARRQSPLRAAQMVSGLIVLVLFLIGRLTAPSSDTVRYTPTYSPAPVIPTWTPPAAPPPAADNWGPAGGPFDGTELRETPEDIIRRLEKVREGRRSSTTPRSP